MTDEGKPVSVSIEQDLPKTTVKVKDLVDGLNKVFSFIQEQNTLDERSDTRRTLGGDYGIRHAEDRLKAALRENYFSDTKTVQSMYDIGIQFDRKGLLQFDEKKFQHALQSDYEQVVDLLAGDGRNFGLIPRLSRALSTITGGANGLLTAQRRTYTGQIDRIDQDLETKSKRAEERIETLKGRLAKAQAALSQMQNQTGFLQGQASAPQLGIPIG
jgi:flagellar hook-associated protein 2